MQEIFGSIWWLIVSLGVLVTFHEFGHFWVARRFGIRVLRFSVGFGKALWSRTGKDGTEYVIAAIPLGGYVKFLDEREDDVPATQRDEAFNRKPAWQRFLVAFAGPAFNLVLCLALLWAMFVIGKADFQPLIGRSEGIAASAGLRADDRIQSIDGQRMDTWTHAALALTGAALDRSVVELQVGGADGDRRVRLDLAQLGEDIDETTVLRDIGLLPRQLMLPPVIGQVAPGTPAARARLQPGDRIEQIGSVSIDGWDQVSQQIQAQAGSGPIALRIGRGADHFGIELTPESRDENGTMRWLLGVSAQPRNAEHDAVLRYGPIEALGAATHETWRLTEATFGMLWRMLNGSASLQNLSGPISIAQYANASAQMGAAWFLFFLAVLSLSLCIMNLLPIPILDGGHLVYCLVEMVKGSPLSERAMIAGQYVGMGLLACLMGLAFYNDIVRLVS
ncbi:MAG: RIP metalloprotease RseP [Chiayiivirga sp.]|uniref:RIP metalloprotease RseP n=1 Tax=Chiayiivirga sp. TaxID=2041042 RepID=UPI0025C66D94|nr:RIP metalloprotease RseP [Chiayiivirga sp.]MCI1710091.1 RIP metalloprotease RseP [Chiayiivirga sp.]MCI1729111.1 RIP metalloprotease RseP [Chiayiivirga sp.]